MREHRELQTLIDQLEAYIREQDEAIKALQKTNEYLVAQLRQALAQPEQEPVDIHCPSCLHSFSIVPVAKREWVGLTDDEIKKIMQRWRNGYIDIKDAEQLLKDKNT